MSNYVQPPEVTDSCMICMEEYKTKQNIYIPKTCAHPICKVCVKKCKNCPYCKKPYKKTREFTEPQKRAKRIDTMLRTMWNFAQEIQKNRTLYGDDDTFSSNYLQVSRNYISTICRMEREHQNALTPRECSSRKLSLGLRGRMTRELKATLIFHKLCADYSHLPGY